METKNAPTTQTQSNTRKTNEPKDAKKNKRQGKPKPVSANELLNTQPSQPAPQQPVQQQQIPSPQLQPQQAFVFNAPAGFVPVVPVMAPIYNFTNAPAQGQQQFFAMPFGAHQPPVPGAPMPQMPQMQQTQGFPQYMPMQYTPTQNAQPANASTKPYGNGKQGGSYKKYQEKSGGATKAKGEHYRDTQQKDQGQMIYQKYKTTLCRHYEETQTCSLGHLCSFAHSKGELRSINDPMPRDFAGKKSQIGALHSNYRTQMCRNWEQTGVCKFAAMCCFAHGQDQLRNMIDPVPQRVPENLLFPPHMQKGPATKNSRGDPIYQQDDYQGDNYPIDYDQNMQGDYQDANYPQQDYGEMQPQDYDNDVYYNSYEQQPQFFTGSMPSAPVWKPVNQEPPMPFAPAQTCNQQVNEQEDIPAVSDDQITA